MRSALSVVVRRAAWRCLRFKCRATRLPRPPSRLSLGVAASRTRKFVASSNQSMMLARPLARCKRVPTANLTRWKIHQNRVVRRYTSGASPTATPGSEASPFAVLGSITSELDRISPRFEIQPSQIQILKSPDQFYSVLKVRFLDAYQLLLMEEII